MPMNDVPDFSHIAPEYSASRPRYPAALFAWLAGLLDRHDVALDVACGSGQAALGLATHFARVIATDVSAGQIENAIQHPHIEYRVAPSEQSGLPSHSVDLVTVAAAVHWFDLPHFYAEAQRVIRTGGVLAAWTYHVAHVEPPLDTVLGPFYRDLLAPYFAPGARLVDARYETLALPGQPLPSPSFSVSVEWTADQVLRFMRTWSGVHAYMAATGIDPVLEIEAAIRDALGGNGHPAVLRWPLYTRASRL
ncbi:MAG TPA: class I SAM-dependent methyltransferase [Candidatus Krumholzibacteria bacterium]|nr:class I SAM-dependent methyltransferase [Candidatus Krumholzibacteria bacterium]